MINIQRSINNDQYLIFPKRFSKLKIEYWTLIIEYWISLIFEDEALSVIYSWQNEWYYKWYAG